MTRDEALALVTEYIKTPNIIKHLLATEAQMRSLAKKFGEDEDKWGITGLLHDLDWDITKATPEKHSLLAEKILKEKGLDEDMVQAIKVHNYVHGLTPQTRLEKALYCGEMMTGFIVAVALVQPSKQLSEVTVGKIMKKYREKSFGAGAKRDIMNLAPDYLGITVEELASITLAAMQQIHGKLGL